MRLSTLVDSLQKQLDIERRRNQDWERLGDLRSRLKRPKMSAPVKA